jgi:3-hydroxypropanoate dehydrogenase
VSRRTLTDEALDLIFRSARTASAWTDEPIPDELLKRVYDDMKWGPTSANTLPLRVVFVKTNGAKERLKPFVMPGNVEKVMKAPVTAIFAQDTRFYEHLPKLLLHADARSWFVGNQPLIDSTAFRNSTLQAAYFMIAARAHGLDCGPMSGFDNAGVDKEFFPDGRFKSNFLCALGVGDRSKLYPRGPRFEFDDVSKIL